MAAMILAASCGNNDKDPVTPQPAPSKSTTEVTDNGDGTFTVPFTVKVSTGNSLAKKMEYSEGEDGKINIKFVVGTNDDEKLRVSGEGVTGELGLKGELDDMTMSTIYVFFGDLTLSNGVTIDDLEKGIDLYYEYGEALTEPASSGKSLLDLVKTCNHLYKGTAKSNEDEITLTDQNTYLAISMSPCCDHTITINTKKFTVKKSNNGRLWIAVPSGNEVKCDELGLSQSAKTVLPSVCHKVARQYFTVADGKKVYFSPGNLQATYNGTEWAWGFAPSQTTIIGEAAANTSINGNGTVSTNGTVDFFGWVGESSRWTGAAMYGISNSTSTNSVDGYGTGKNEALKSDWGKVFGEDSPWYTLSHEEWVYLLGNGSDPSRSGASDLRHWASVNSVNGLIILPDGYDTEGLDWSSIDWATLESAGAVFLPAAGCRFGTGVYDVGSYGCYWSSSAYDEDIAWFLNFGSDYVYPGYDGDRGYGQSVRLVRPL